MADEAHPVMVRVRIPALVRGNELITETGIFGRIVRKAQEAENGPKGLSGPPCSLVIRLQILPSFVKRIRSDRRERGARCQSSHRYGTKLLEGTRQTSRQVHEPEEAARITKKSKGRVVLVDAADATSSGASGDSNAILRALVEANCSRSVLLPLVDPAAVEIAFRAGVGSTIEIKVGGDIDSARFTPLPVKVNVTMLSDGRFRSESHGDIWNGGKTAVLKMDNYTLVVTSRAVNLYDRSLFLAHGQDPAQFDAVVVKSPHCRASLLRRRRRACSQCGRARLLKRKSENSGP